jgi:CRP/FNR family cyclic AMP-dependent transcriptional regulator
VLSTDVFVCYITNMLTTKSQHNALVNLFHQGTRLTYKKGEFVIRPGETPSGIFYIVKGLVKTYDITKYGEENLLVIRREGEVLGLTGAITGRHRNIIYSTLAPTELLQITNEQFTTFLNNNPAAAMPLIDMLVNMYLVHSDRILTLEYRSVRERLISFLLTTARRFGEHQDDNNEIVLAVPLKHQDIASSISATRETTSRELATLERQGLISRDKQSIITLLDVEKLHSYLS